MNHGVKLSVTLDPHSNPPFQGEGRERVRRSLFVMRFKILQSVQTKFL